MGVRRTISETVTAKTYINFELPNIFLITGKKTLPKNEAKTKKTDYKGNGGWKGEEMEGKGAKEIEESQGGGKETEEQW